MGINITHTMNSFQFEHNEDLRNAARRILNKQGASSESMQRIIEQTIFTSQKTTNAQFDILSTSAQITLNNSLKETLKYLKSQANKKTAKKHVLGELWNTVNVTENTYQGELIDFVIDTSIKNIFTAA